MQLRQELVRDHINTHEMLNIKIMWKRPVKIWRWHLESLALALSLKSLLTSLAFCW